MNPNQQAVYQELVRLKNLLSIDHPIFGPIEDGVLCLPRDLEDDARKASWPKKFRLLAETLLNQPVDMVSCPSLLSQSLTSNYDIGTRLLALPSHQDGRIP